MTDHDEGTPVKRRDAIKTIAVAASLPVLGSVPGEIEAQAKPAPAGQPPAPPQRLTTGPRGTASDPDLLRPKKDWPRKLSAIELTTLAALCDMIIPADEKSPSASAVGAPAYINEYVSAPLDGSARDLVRVRGGVAWLNLESTKRFGRTFARLTTAEKTQICDDICFVPKAAPEFRQGARFFSLVRNLTATAFYTTDEGMKDIGYVGNVALPKWDLPPAAVLKHLGLE
jgi:gluconate 2-dehydrogenase gamma chain